MRGEIDQATGGGPTGQVPQRAGDGAELGGTGGAIRIDRELFGVGGRKAHAGKRLHQILAGIVEHPGGAAILSMVVAGHHQHRPLGEVLSLCPDRQQQKTQQNQKAPHPLPLTNPATSSICDDQRNWSIGVTGPSR